MSKWQKIVGWTVVAVLLVVAACVVILFITKASEGEVAGAMATEAGAREAADVSLAGSLVAEAQLRQTGDQDLTVRANELEEDGVELNQALTELQIQLQTEVSRLDQRVTTEVTRLDQEVGGAIRIGESARSQARRTRQELEEAVTNLRRGGDCADTTNAGVVHNMTFTPVYVPAR